MGDEKQTDEQTLDEATRLEQETLVPLKQLKAARTTLASAFTVVADTPVLGNLTVSAAPPLKTAKLVLPSKSKPTAINVTVAFSMKFAQKCIARVNLY